MRTLSKSSSTATGCGMPDHGNPNAVSPCCQPGSDQYMSGPAAGISLGGSSTLAFWTDKPVWRVAARNTFNCLVGCMVGDLAVVIYMQAKHPGASMVFTMILAMAAGLVTSILFETLILKLREGFKWGAAFTTAFSMSFLSMLAMEFAANATDFMLTGGRVPLSDPFYWIALALAVGAGFLLPLPYNYWKFKRHGAACH